MPGTNRKAVAAISVLGTAAALVLGLWDNAYVIRGHADPSIRLDDILDDRAMGIAATCGWILGVMAVLTAVLVRGKRRIHTIKWILLGDLVAVSIAGSVVLFEFVVDFAIR